MKKFMTIMFILIIGILFAANVHFSSEVGPITTTASYATSTDTEIATMVYGKNFILIENTGSESMYISAWGYAYNGSSYYEEFLTDKSIAASGDYTIALANTVYSKIIIRQKSNSGSTTSYISYNQIP